MNIQTPREFAVLKKTGMKRLFPKEVSVAVGMASCGLARGAQDVFRAFKKEFKKQNLAGRVTATGCSGWCSKEPLVSIMGRGMPRVTLGEVSPRHVAAIVGDLKEGTAPREGVLYRTDAEQHIADNSTHRYVSGRLPAMYRTVPLSTRMPYFRKQKRIVLRNCGRIDPGSIEEYVACGGFAAAYRALCALSPEEVVTEVQRSGLRGRGGAGYPTGLKWQAARKAEGEQKYIICNADEGDPGAYMDRSLLEGDPFSVLEGILIAAKAVGASRGYIYVRDEYPLAVKRVREAIAAARRHGFLGKHIFGSDFTFTLRVERGAGAFVCGEETALIAALEGRPGEPVDRPPFPVQRGLHGMPTCINNVETLANVPVILSRGGRWFARTGTRTNTGTKIFSLVGDVERVGLIEVPMGTSLHDIVEIIGGGAPRGARVKAIQTGGPSGGCIPRRLFDLPVDYESLTSAGAIMGSGGMIVMDENTCMVDVAKYFMEFLKEESCGKCLPCREGTAASFDILDRIVSGKGLPADLALLKDTCRAMQGASLCGLGRTAANPVLSALRHFPGEFKTHISRKSCPAGICTALITFVVDPDKCTGCGVCARVCPSGAVSGTHAHPHVISTELCIGCRACYTACPTGAVEIR